MIRILIVGVLMTSLGWAAVPVNYSHFARAESDTMFKGTLALAGEIGAWVHLRAPTPLDQQNVIRMNRDTLYSVVIVDLAKPATITLPEADGRYMSAHAVNQASPVCLMKSMLCMLTLNHCQSGGAAQ